MIRIQCPLCGLRDHAEFQYIGDATKVRPKTVAPGNEEKWFDYVYIRDNPKGPHEEYWQHIFGCRSLVKVKRNTVTHEITGTSLPDKLLDPVTGIKY